MIATNLSRHFPFEGSVRRRELRVIFCGLELIMHLDYRLSENWDSDPGFLLAADETDLRYYTFAGDIILRDTQTDLSTHWGWVPLVDFAVGLREISAAIEVGIAPAKNFEFTESDATLEFERHGADVTIRSSYAPGKIILPCAEFRKRVLDFARRLDMELLSRLPRLGQNAAYQSLKLSGLRD
jgi:hypothetical protein